MNSIFDHMYRIMFFLLISLTFLSCKKENEVQIIDFGMEGSFVVSGSVPIAFETALSSASVYNSLDSVMGANGFSTENIKDVELRSWVLTVNDSISNLDFLKSIDIELSGGSQDRMLVATSGELTGSVGETLELTVTTRDISPYLVGDSILLWPTVVLDQALIQPVEVNMDISLQLETR